MQKGEGDAQPAQLGLIFFNAADAQALIDKVRPSVRTFPGCLTLVCVFWLPVFVGCLVVCIVPGPCN